ncbi:hypothetical protein [Chitinimonas koreensis]|uniref:hypothetical protein n=1 Tax=Chitinimonas koreensis TaxID=356302 RepID=UPI0003F6D6A2|nr:hypothetical protein [Chitinimonas koreensis]QNM98670.1 hypothetical protein H9L41_10870 [Chitinimonas koreensis]
MLSMLWLKATIELLGGFAVGYLLASLIESYMHQHVSDAPRGRVKRWERHPRLFKYLIRTNYSHHTIHHCKTFKQDHVTQFTSAEERSRLDAMLSGLGPHGEIIQRSMYAVKLHGSGSLVFVAPLLPVVPLCLATAGGWATAGACLALALPPAFSNFIHPYLHMRHTEALERAPRWIAMLLKTRYFKAMARHHYLHHRYVVCNFNLLLGGDRLRRVARKAGEQDLARMRELGLPLD